VENITGANLEWVGGNRWRRFANADSDYLVDSYKSGEPGCLVYHTFYRNCGTHLFRYISRYAVDDYLIGHGTIYQVMTRLDDTMRRERIDYDHYVLRSRSWRLRGYLNERLPRLNRADRELIDSFYRRKFVAEDYDAPSARCLRGLKHLDLGRRCEFESFGIRWRVYAPRELQDAESTSASSSLA
jgi:hypothetical protein